MKIVNGNFNRCDCDSNALKESAESNQIYGNKDVEKLVFNDINKELEALRPSYDYERNYVRIEPYRPFTSDKDYWYFEDNYNYYKGHDKQNLILHHKGYSSVTKDRLKAIAQAIKNIGGKYIAIKYGQIYFYLDLTKYFEKDAQEKQKAAEDRKEKLMAIDIDKYRPNDALISKAKQYYMTNSTRFVRKIDNVDTYLTYYYLAQLLNWGDLLDVIRDRASSLNLSKYYDIEDAIDLKVKPEKIDRGNSAFVSNFSNVIKFCIDNNIQWKATSRRATSREYEKDTRNGAIYTIAYDFEVSGQTLPVAIHTDEGGGRPYGYMIDNNVEVSGIKQATSIIIDWIKKVAGINESCSGNYCFDCSESLKGREDIETFFKMAKQIGITDIGELETFLKNEKQPDDRDEWDTMLRYRASLGNGNDFKIKEALAEDEDTDDEEDDEDGEEEFENTIGARSPKDAKRWLDDMISEYGNTYSFPREARRELNKLVNDFGNTYFWDRLDEAAKKSEDTCVLCGEKIEGHGNNPAPLKDSGKCCDKCNITKVIPARLKLVKNEEFKESDGAIEAKEDPVTLPEIDEGIERKFNVDGMEYDDDFDSKVESTGDLNDFDDEPAFDY